MTVSTALALAYALNLFDLAATTLWVQWCGAGVESNPLGRLMLSHNAAPALKILVVGVLLEVLAVLIRRHPKATWVAYIPLGAYAIIAVYHIVLFVVVQIIVHR